jgi:hypothetical protein
VFAGTGIAGAATLAPASAPTEQSNCLVATLTSALNGPIGTLSSTVGCVVPLP